MNLEKKPEKALVLHKISKTFRVREKESTTFRGRLGNVLKQSKVREIKALSNIGLEVEKGEIFGIVGRNGSGKSTLLNIMMESIRPDKGGEIMSEGLMLKLSLGMGVDLNLSARDNIYINGSIIGLSFRTIGQIFQEIIDFAGLQDFVDTPVRFYSKGMRQRLMFSIAMYAQADIFLLDEFFGGTGDQDFKKKSDKAFKERILEGKTIVIVSHSMHIIRKYCKRVLWLDKGQNAMMGPAANVLEAYEATFETQPAPAL